MNEDGRQPDRFSWHDPRLWLLTGVLGALTAAVFVFEPAAPAPTAPVTRFTVALPPGGTWPVLGPILAFSPDGRSLVYSVAVGSETRLFVRRMDEVDSLAIPGTEGGVWPFFSSDGQWVGFHLEGQLKKVALTGGAPLTITSGGNLGPGSWGPDGSIVFECGGTLCLAPAGGSVRSEFTTRDPRKGRDEHRNPEFLPDGRTVIFTAGPPEDGRPWYDAEIVAKSLDSGERHVLIHGAAQAHYVRTGHLVFARAGTLFVVPFDAKTLRVGGPPVAVLEGVAEDQAAGVSQFAVSPTGSLAYVPGGLKRNEVMWVDRHGRAEPLLAGSEPRYVYQPRLSPDGHQLAVTVVSGNDDVWVHDLRRDVLSRFTAGDNHIYPGWTPDGTYITYIRSDVLLRRRADFGGSEEVLADKVPGLVPHSWTPDGELLLFTVFSPSSRSDIWMLRLSDGGSQPLLNSGFAERTPMLSPDGRWLAYTSDESGRVEVYVQPFPGDGTRARISRDGGTEPLWARDGKELFFRHDDTLMAVAMTNGQAAGRPQALFTSSSWAPPYRGRTNYDVASDGRFVMLWKREPDMQPQIHVVLNWADQLRDLGSR